MNAAKQRRWERLAEAETRLIRAGVYVPQPAHRALNLWIETTPKRLRPNCGRRCRDGHACPRRVVDGWSVCKGHGVRGGPKTEAGPEAIAESNRRRARERREAAERLSA